MANINGTSQDDVLRGTTAADVIWARSGNDRISGLAGHDRLYGQAGNDTIYGGDGNDRIGGGLGNDQLFGHGGDDTLFGDARRDYLWGDAGNDELSGGADNDVLRGNSGNDTLRGDGGNDLLDGGAGNDLFYGGTGADHFIGGDGIDTVSFFHEEYGVFVHMVGQYAANGDPEMVDPTVEEQLEGVERVRGSTHDDLMFAQIEDGLPIQWTQPLAFFGLGGNDRIFGGSAGDELEGNDGDDFINGEDGGDHIDGGAGADHLSGGKGTGEDRVTGGEDLDLFQYSVVHGRRHNDSTGKDIFTDFRSGEDTLSWSAFVQDEVDLSRLALFAALDTDGSGRIDGRDSYSDSKVVEGSESLVVDFSALLNARLDSTHSLKGTLSGDTLTLLGVTELRTQDIHPV
jgi:Ca2+-binding RTX toxin-like protein